MFELFWREGLLASDAVNGIDRTWSPLDGAIPARWGRKPAPNPTDRGRRGAERSVLTDGRGTPIGVTLAGTDRDDHPLMRDTLDGLGG